MMTHDAETRERLYWLSNPEWYGFDEDRGYYLTEYATKRARESYEKWKRMQYNTEFTRLNDTE